MRRLAVIAAFVGAFATLALGVYLVYLVGVIGALRCFYGAGDAEPAADYVVTLVSLTHVAAAALALPAASAFMARGWRLGPMIVATAGAGALGSAIWFATSEWSNGSPVWGWPLFGAPSMILLIGGILGIAFRNPPTLLPDLAR